MFDEGKIYDKDGRSEFSNIQNLPRIIENLKLKRVTEQLFIHRAVSKKMRLNHHHHHHHCQPFTIHRWIKALSNHLPFPSVSSDLHPHAILSFTSSRMYVPFRYISRPSILFTATHVFLLRSLCTGSCVTFSNLASEFHILTS
jgi:hypothetical protein